MIKKVGIVLLGIIVANLLIMCVEAIGHMLYPVEVDIFSLTPEEQKLFIKSLPLGALLMIWVAYVVGSVIGGFVVGKIGKSEFGIKASC